MSEFSTSALSAPVIGGSEVFDIVGAGYAVSMSSTSVQIWNPNSPGWSELSYVSTGTDNLPSGNSSDYWSITYGYARTLDENICVFVNDVDWPKFFIVDSSTTTYSDFTYHFSLASEFKSVAFVDDRLVGFNYIESATTRRPTGLAWSARGNPLDWDIASGAGGELLADMRGLGRKIVTNPNSSRDAYLLTDLEIWRMTGTSGPEGFVFEPVTREIGAPYPNTAVQTPFGVIFLGRNLELYLLDNSGLPRALGPDPNRRNPKSRIRAFLQNMLRNPTRAWATFNRTKSRYELYYPDLFSPNGFPNKALYFHLDQGVFTSHTIPNEVTYGFEFGTSTVETVAPPENITWDSITDTWDSVTSTWDDFGSSPDLGTFPPTDKTTLAFRNNDGASAYRWLSDQTTDYGNEIDCRWRSHGLQGQDTFRRSRLGLVEVEYRSTDTGNLGLRVTTDGGDSWPSHSTASTTPTNDSLLRFPVQAAGRAPQFEILVKDGSRPKLSRFVATLIQESRR